MIVRGRFHSDLPRKYHARRKVESATKLRNLTISKLVTKFALPGIKFGSLPSPARGSGMNSSITHESARFSQSRFSASVCAASTRIPQAMKTLNPKPPLVRSQNAEDMNVFVLSAGYATRLYPLILTKPAPLQAARSAGESKHP
jgi:hypothetical protein